VTSSESINGDKYDIWLGLNVGFLSESWKAAKKKPQSNKTTNPSARPTEVAVPTVL
jgi:hypothetical protein